jgi:uncharacterized protein YpmB
MKSDLIIFFILFVVIIIIILMFFKLYEKTYTTKEGFLSGFRQMYRPYIRKARLYTTSKYNSLSDKTSVFLRRWGFW